MPARPNHIFAALVAVISLGTLLVLAAQIPQARSAGIPESTITALPTDNHQSTMHNFSGTAADTDGVALVEVALLRLGSDRGLGAQEDCQWLTTRGVSFVSEFAVGGKCTDPRWLIATGTTQWSFALSADLPLGRYALFARATNVGGTTEASFTTAGGNLQEFRVSRNPCIGPQRNTLLCPDLVMGPPSDLRVDRKTRKGRVLLRAKNQIHSRGAGPLELRGTKVSEYAMSVKQHIKRRGGADDLVVPTAGRLGFYPIPGQGHYWKFRDAAGFELWRVNEFGEKTQLVRRGPKQYYCFRDLKRTLALPQSPRKRVYPACNQHEETSAVTLGTSVGWSDIYPAPYHEQWIDVTGLRGTFAYVHIADPLNSLRESREDNNTAEVIVELPFTPV